MPLLIIAVVYFLRREPEHLLEIPPGASDVTVQGGTVYWTKRPNGFVELYSVPVTGGTVRRIVKDNIGTRSVWAFQYGSREAVYTLTEPLLPAANRAGQPAGSMVAVTAPPFLRVKAKRPKSARTARTADAWPRIVRWVDLSTGSVRSIRLPFGARSFAVAGKDLYWVRSNQAEWDIVRDLKGTHREATATDDLMVTSLESGRTRKLASGIFPVSNLLLSMDAVYWLRPRPYPDTRQDLFGIRVSDGHRIFMPDYPNTTSGTGPVAYQKRLYWMDPTGAVMSAGETGAGIRVDWPLPSDGRVMARRGVLFVHTGSLYLDCYETASASSRDRTEGYYAGAINHTLVRLATGRPDPVAGKCLLALGLSSPNPSRPSPNGEYLYLIASEGRAGTSPSSGRYLTRVRLP